MPAALVSAAAFASPRKGAGARSPRPFGLGRRARAPLVGLAFLDSDGGASARAARCSWPVAESSRTAATGLSRAIPPPISTPWPRPFGSPSRSVSEIRLEASVARPSPHARISVGRRVAQAAVDSLPFRAEPSRAERSGAAAASLPRSSSRPSATRPAAATYRGSRGTIRAEARCPPR